MLNKYFELYFPGENVECVLGVCTAFVRNFNITYVFVTSSPLNMISFKRERTVEVNREAYARVVVVTSLRKDRTLAFASIVGARKVEDRLTRGGRRI